MSSDPLLIEPHRQGELSAADRMRRSSIVLLTTALLLISSPVVAQPPTAIAEPPPRLSLDANVGLGVGLTHGSYRRERAGFAGDAAAALRLGASDVRAFVVAFAASVQGSLGTSDICVLDPNGGCVPPFPNFLTFGPLAGWENASGQVRALAGPAFTHEDARHVIGLQARIDGATRSFAQLALAVSMRGVVFPDYRGDALTLMTFGVGIRIR